MCAICVQFTLLLIFIHLSQKKIVLKDTHLCVNPWVDHEKISSELLGKYESLLTAYVESAETSILFCQDVRTLYISLKSFSHKSDS